MQYASEEEWNRSRGVVAAGPGKDQELQDAIEEYNALSAELKRRRAAANMPASNAVQKRKSKQKAQKTARRRNR